MKIAPLFVLPVTFLLTACPNSEGEGANIEDESSSYPDSPESLIIELNEDGGMMPRGEDIYICSDSAYWKLWNHGNETFVRWTPAKEDFESLYATLKENNFDKIKSDCEGEVFDRGGTSIDVTLEGKRTELNDAQNCFIKEKWHTNFKAINRAIRAYTGKEVRKKMLDVTLSTSDNAYNSGMPFAVGVNLMSVHHQDRRGPRDTTIAVYPGLNEIYVQFFYQDSLNSYGSPATWKSEQFFIDCDETTTKILIDLEADAIDVIKIP